MTPVYNGGFLDLTSYLRVSLTHTLVGQEDKPRRTPIPQATCTNFRQGQ